jgi:hypothetical protein
MKLAAGAVAGAATGMAWQLLVLQRKFDLCEQVNTAAATGVRKGC